MNDFVFQNKTKIYFGKDQLTHLGEEAAAFGKKVLLVYGGGSIKRIGLYDKVVDVLTKAGMTISELGGVEPNPRHTTVNKGVKICREEGIDVILAVGGGSTIDASKVMAATVAADTDDCWDLVMKKVVSPKALPLMTVLTIAATGSEMNAGAVISNVDTKDKLPYFSPAVQPAASFLDPTNTFSVPAYQTASGSVDIMAHIFDMGYFSRQPRMDMIYRVQDEVLKTVVKFAPIALKEPDNYEARANLMWASTWALNGFLAGGVSQMTSCHRMEHELSAVYDITHGHGLAILIPRWLKYVMNDDNAWQIKRLGTNVFGLDDGLSDREGAEKAIEALSDFFFKTLGLDSRLSDLGIDDKHFRDMAENACKQLGGTLHGFIDLTPDDIVKIYEMCL